MLYSFGIYHTLIRWYTLITVTWHEMLTGTTFRGAFWGWSDPFLTLFSVCRTCSGVFLSGTSVSLFLWMTSLALRTPENVHIIIVQNIITSKHSTGAAEAAQDVVRLLIRKLRSDCLFHTHSMRKILIALPGSSSQHKDAQSIHIHAQSIHVYYIPSHTWTMHV